MPLPSRISKSSAGLLHAAFAFLLLLSTSASRGQADKAQYDLGKDLFTKNCASCHKPDSKLTGPALKGAKERWAKSGGDIYAWVKNSQAYLKSSGDAYAAALFAEYNGSVMTPNALDNGQID